MLEAPEYVIVMSDEVDSVYADTNEQRRVVTLRLVYPCGNAAKLVNITVRVWEGHSGHRLSDVLHDLFGGCWDYTRWGWDTVDGVLDARAIYEPVN